MALFNKNEIKYLILAVLFCLVWFMLALPYLIGRLDGSYILQFLLFNIGLVVFLQIFLKTVILKTRVKSIIGLVILFVALDCLTPPYVLDMEGIFHEGIILAKSSSDYFLASLGMNFGFAGNLLYVWTYVISPIILLGISALLIKDFVRSL